LLLKLLILFFKVLNPIEIILRSETGLPLIVGSIFIWQYHLPICELSHAADLLILYVVILWNNIWKALILVICSVRSRYIHFIHNCIILLFLINNLWLQILLILVILIEITLADDCAPSLVLLILNVCMIEILKLVFHL
jgi:hypothetical protein